MQVPRRHHEGGARPAEKGPKSRHAAALAFRRKLNHAAESLADMTLGPRGGFDFERGAQGPAAAGAAAGHQLGWLGSWGVRCGVRSYSEYDGCDSAGRALMSSVRYRYWRRWGMCPRRPTHPGASLLAAPR